LFKSLEKQLKKIERLEQIQISAEFDPYEPTSVEAAIGRLSTKIFGIANPGHKEDFVKEAAENFVLQGREMIIKRAAELRQENERTGMTPIPTDNLGVQLDKIKSLVQDLQYVDWGEAGDRISRLSKSLGSSTMKPYKDALIKDLNFDDFLEKSKNSGGSMVGSSNLLWPEDDDEKLGIQLLFVDHFAEKPDRLVHYGSHFFGANNYDVGVHKIASNILAPLERDLRAFIARQRGEKTSFPLPTKQSNKIFVVHGHDEGMEQGVARFLEKLNLEPIILHEQSNQGATIIEKLEANSSVGFAIVLMSPDDVGRSKNTEKLEDRPRQNVVLEAGWFMGRFGRERTIVLKRDTLEMPSDLQGLVYIPYDFAGGWRAKVVEELRSAGYDVQLA